LYAKVRIFLKSGICFMVDDKMCVGTYKGGIMARVDPEEEETLAAARAGWYRAENP
jgi:hypothetical protein